MGGSEPDRHTGLFLEVPRMAEMELPHVPLTVKIVKRCEEGIDQGDEIHINFTQNNVNVPSGNLI